MSKKIPFKISARTARLIGRQNFPNAEGAIIELVKNSYDADASTCIVFLDNQYAVLPTTLTFVEYTRFSKQHPLIPKYFHLDSGRGEYIFKEPAPQTEDEELKVKLEKHDLQDFFQSLCKLFIIDDGEGMTGQIIEDFWMTIGTNNKEVMIFTSIGRVKTGAKGIGRFALDKLGDSAEMLTKPDAKTYREIAQNTAFLWQVDWNAFEGDAKTLNEVEADLISEEVLDFSEEVKDVLPPRAKECLESELNSFTTGTRIQISNLRDQWTHSAVDRLYANLEVLIPPREERVFNVFLFSSLEPNKYGRVSPSICDDYDYKVDARIDSDGIAEITIYRNEFDITKFPTELFEQESMKREGFSKGDFQKGKIVILRHITELAPGLANLDEGDTLRNIGDFDFIFYFMKAQTTKKDQEVFLYKDFNSASRKTWLDQFGGIKLFRDNFRVRPYGEIKNPAFDWLQLGERASRSPSSLGQEGRGGWLVRPNQITGIINISRLTNIDFEDTSSRYGLQENRTFWYFTQIIKGILGVFEKDRSEVGRALRVYYDLTHQPEVNEKEVGAVKRRVEARKSKKAKSEAEQDAETLSNYTTKLEEQIEEMKDEASLLRILASSGLITASFTHELKNIKDNLVYRIDELKGSLHSATDDEKISKLPHFRNPFTMLEIVRNEDEKLKEWLHYSLESLRRDKRRRKNIDLLEYLEKYKNSWGIACRKRSVQFDLELPSEALKMSVFEADLDCIFNNLLINSFEAFLRRDAPSTRVVTVKLDLQQEDIVFTYLDSGPGLSKDIVEPEEIFRPHFTTKKDLHTGEEIGTGLGMWLVKLFVLENKGSINLLKEPTGFGVSIKFPYKTKSNETT